MPPKKDAKKDAKKEEDDGEKTDRGSNRYVIIVVLQYAVANDY